MNVWEGQAQGVEDAMQFATSILKVADLFNHLKNFNIKSIVDILDKLIAGANISMHILADSQALCRPS